MPRHQGNRFASENQLFLGSMFGAIRYDHSRGQLQLVANRCAKVFAIYQSRVRLEHFLDIAKCDRWRVLLIRRWNKRLLHNLKLSAIFLYPTKNLVKCEVQIKKSNAVLQLIIATSFHWMKQDKVFCRST